MPDTGAIGTPALVGMIGGIVGMFAGLSSLYDRYYKGRPVASLSTTDAEPHRICVRMKNTTDYDVVVIGSVVKPAIYYLGVNMDDRSALDSTDDPHFMLKPGESKELLILSRIVDNLPLDLRNQYVEFKIAWRRGDSSWMSRRAIPVCTYSKIVRLFGLDK